MLKQLQADYEEVLRREAEKEQQQKIREQIREEARVAREYKRELERVERERQMIEQAIAAAMKKAGAEHSAEVDALRQKLAEAEERGRRTQAQAELTKAGHVYVISNLGAFGEHIYKVGMTRRLIPTDRVRELGDASVPFPFDVHMMNCGGQPRRGGVSGGTRGQRVSADAGDFGTGLRISCAGQRSG